MPRRILGAKKRLEKHTNLAKTALVATAGSMLPISMKSPDEAYEELFHEVQSRQVYKDGKTFVDMVPRKRAKELKKIYDRARQQPDFDLPSFVDQYFYVYRHGKKQAYVPTEATTAREHVSQIWNQLEVRNRKTRGTLLALPHAYIVPGGRFTEQFYWDTYFVMIGLAADNEWGKIIAMTRNYGYLLRKYGFIPTANRSYFMSRSQPPFFSHMVRLLTEHRGARITYAEFLPFLLTEYRFWMKGRRSLSARASNRAYARVVKMPDGSTMNRYYDNKVTPRPESRREDIETAGVLSGEEKDKLFLDLRAGAESGWDFSSRWFRNPADIQSIYTTDIVPVDLNCLLHTLEETIADAYSALKQPLLAKRFRSAASRRKQYIQKYCWDEQAQFFGDYDFREEKMTGRLTLAGVFPLFTHVATVEQAELVAKRIERDFLKTGGLVATLEQTAQQWDAPNGWAPLHWVVIKGLQNYGHHDLAHRIRDAWLKTNEQVFARERKMVEKYNVEDPDALGGGGEYPLQDGFGWTNGVYAALKDEQEKTK